MPYQGGGAGGPAEFVPQQQGNLQQTIQDTINMIRQFKSDQNTQDWKQREWSNTLSQQDATQQQQEEENKYKTGELGVRQTLAQQQAAKEAFQQQAEGAKAALAARAQESLDRYHTGMVGAANAKAGLTREEAETKQQLKEDGRTAGSFLRQYNYQINKLQTELKMKQGASAITTADPADLAAIQSKINNLNMAKSQVMKHAATLTSGQPWGDEQRKSVEKLADIPTIMNDRSSRIEQDQTAGQTPAPPATPQPSQKMALTPAMLAAYKQKYPGKSEAEIIAAFQRQYGR